MNLKQLEYFTAIAEAGSITGAAAQLHIAQPPLSHQLRALEEELGVRLVQRGPRRCTLTEAGRHLYERARQILELTETTRGELCTLAGENGPELRIGMISSSGGLLMRGGMRRFIEESPDVRFKIYEQNTFGIMELLRQGLVDVGVVRTPFAREGLSVVAFEEEPMIAAWLAAEDFGIPAGETGTLLDAQRWPLTIYRRFERLLEETSRAEGALLNVRCYSDDARTALQWAHAGLGVAVVPRCALSLVDSTDIKSRPFAEAALRTQICVVWPQERAPSRVAAEFIAALTRPQGHAAG